MNKADVARRISQSCDGMGMVELSGVSLEAADPKLLDITALDFDQHVAMQPSAVAFYGALLKTAARELAAFERSIGRWEKKKWAEAKASLVGMPRATVADIEARFVVDNEAEIEKHEKQVEVLRSQHDALAAWFEAWRQKGFSMKEYASIIDNERWAEKTGASIKGLDGGQTVAGSRRASVSKVRSMIQKRRESSGAVADE